MDCAAAHYHKDNKAAKPAVATPPCADPGPFVAPVAAAASAPGAKPAAAPVQAKK